MDDNAAEEVPVRLPREAMSSWMLGPAAANVRRDAKHHLVDQVRTIINTIVMLDVGSLDDATHASLAEDLARVTERLSALPALATTPAQSGGDDARMLERSGVTGASNPLSAPLHLWLDGDVVRGHAEYSEQYEGPPGCVHGGFVAAAFDDLLGSAQTLSGTAGFTGTLTIRMSQPTPLKRRIDYEGGVTSITGRKILTWGKATHAGVVLASAEGLFITPKDADADRMRQMQGKPAGA